MVRMDVTSVVTPYAHPIGTSRRTERHLDRGDCHLGARRRHLDLNPRPSASPRNVTPPGGGIVWRRWSRTRTASRAHLHPGGGHAAPGLRAPPGGGDSIQAPESVRCPLEARRTFCGRSGSIWRDACCRSSRPRAAWVVATPTTTAIGNASEHCHRATRTQRRPGGHRARHGRVLQHHQVGSAGPVQIDHTRAPCGANVTPPPRALPVDQWGSPPNGRPASDDAGVWIIPMSS